MSNSKLHFSLVSPERSLFSGDVDQVVVPASNGQMGALVKHAPTMGVVNAGIIKIIDNANTTLMYVGGGIVDVNPEGVTILAEDAVDIAKIDKAKIETDIKNTKEDIGKEKDPKAKAKFEKALIRLETILAAA